RTSSASGRAPPPRDDWSLTGRTRAAQAAQAPEWQRAARKRRPVRPREARGPFADAVAALADAADARVRKAMRPREAAWRGAVPRQLPEAAGCARAARPRDRRRTHASTRSGRR